VRARELLWGLPEQIPSFAALFEVSWAVAARAGPRSDEDPWFESWLFLPWQERARFCNLPDRGKVGAEAVFCNCPDVPGATVRVPAGSPGCALALSLCC